MNQIRQKKGKAAHLLFHDIESDLNEKGNFLNDQAGKIEEMIKMYNTMIAKISVLKSSATLFDMTDENALGGLDFEKDSGSEPLLADSNKLKFCYMGGTLLRED
jgi:hypothetical protein